MAEHVLGIDAAPTGGRAVVVSSAGEVVRRVDLPPAGLLDEAFAAGVGAVGWSFEPPDAGESKGGVAHIVPLAVQAPVIQCTPGAAAVVAEAWIGAARGARHAICLVLGDDVRAGLLLDGRPWRGAHGRAGAAAWLALNPVERQDYRRFGSLAAEVSDKGIARRLAWRIQAGDQSAVAQEGSDLDAITAAQVFQGARDGDGVAIAVVRDTARYVGMAVANLAVTVDPEVVVVSGALARAEDLLLEPVRQEFSRRVPPALAGQTRIEFSPLAEDAVAIGAARLAMLARA